jgi:hypothetical protein
MREDGALAVRWLARGMHEVPDSADWLSRAESHRRATLRFPKRRTGVRLGRWTANQAIAHVRNVVASEMTPLFRH